MSLWRLVVLSITADGERFRSIEAGEMDEHEAIAIWADRVEGLAAIPPRGGRVRCALVDAHGSTLRDWETPTISNASGRACDAAG